ncbi:HEAT repeat-containing protein 1 homolog [Neodiprion lecontei]|uniref:HEAT repeat-containing protein 1 n=1 Tax=Neodiprion lecontei TaxID=441921 RepID=A0A6J0B6R6_NEOLC|nr:HEAT repeat-containing protein 1 homolog [Neodiprion lecontei]
MATSLQSQLSRLRAPQTSLLIQKKKQPSLLFDPKEAANLDRETVFEIGQNGLEELIKLSEMFAEFKRDLFSHSTVGLERSVHDKAINKVLDGRIKRFLILLSPYFLLNPAHKTLEWLIRRFHIHEFNRDQFLLLILPYHETRMFVRALQLVNVSQASDNWHWLEPLQKPGVPLATTTLINRVSTDSGLLRNICEHICEATEVCGAQASSLGTLYAFYTMTLIGVLDRSKPLNENQMTHLLFALEKGLTSKVVDFASSSYMLVGKICSKAKLKKETLNHIAHAMLTKPPLQYEPILLLVFMFNSQPVSVSAKVINKLSELTWFPEMLAKVKSSGGKIENFVVKLLGSCIRCVQKDRLDAYQKVHKMGEDLLKAIRFSDDEVDAILEKTLRLHVPIDNISEESTKFLVNFFHAIEKQYPEKFDAYLKSLVQKGESDAESQKVLGLLLPWHADIRSAQGTMQVLDRLHHIDPNQRIAGLKLVAENRVQVSKNYCDMVTNALLARFRDDNEDVILTLLTMFSADKLKSLFTVDVLVDELLRLVLKSNPYSPTVFGIPALRILLSLCSHYDTRVFITVLPYLFPRNKDEVKISMEVLNSDYANNNTYMQMVKSDAGYEPCGPEAISSAAFHRILDTTLLPSTASILLTLKQQETHGNAVSMFFSMILLGSVCRVPVGLLSHEVARDIIDIASKVLKSYPKVRLLPNCNQLNGDKIVDALELASKEVLPLQVGTYVLEMVHRRLDLSANPTLDFERAPERSQLVLNFIQIFFEGVNKPDRSEHYLWCLKIFLKRHFTNAEDTICFLSQLFAQPVLPQTSLHCLQITYSLLESKQSLQWAFQDCTFIPNLLIALANKNTECRASAVKILQRLSHSFNLSTDGFSALLGELMERKAEIKMDHEQLSLILYTLLSPDPDVQHQITPNRRLGLQDGLAQLLATATSISTPIHTVAQILDILSHVNGVTVLQTLAPLGISLLDQIQGLPCAPKFAGSALKNILQRFDASTAGALSDKLVLQLFDKSIKDYKSRIRFNSDYQPPSVILMKQIDETFFKQAGKLSKIQQAKILASIIDAVTDCELSSVVAAGNRAVRQIRLDAQLIVDELTLMANAKLAVPAGKKSKVAASLDPRVISTRAWKRGITLLEFVQRADNVDRAELLVPILFDLLRVSLKFEEQSALEYTNQLILSSILHLSVNSLAITEGHAQVDLIAECIRTSQNPQTHHHALLVLVELFKVADLKVALNNIMPIFTFMGSSVLRQDDAYSIQIISKTIETIVPIINAAEDEMYACDILRVFITSLPDIPEHRRGPLFVKLLQLLEKHLHLFFLLSFESHVLAIPKKGEEKTRELSSPTLEFALNISQEFTQRQLINVCIKIMQFTQSLPTEVEDEKGLRTAKFDGQNHIFDVNQNTGKQLRHFKHTVLLFVSSLLSSSWFVNKVAELDAEETMSLKNDYYELIVEIVKLVELMAKSYNANQTQSKGTYWKVMLHRAYDVLDNVNSLLSNHTFVESVERLMHHNSILIRKKALELLNTRLLQKNFGPDDRDVLFTLMEPLMRLASIGKQKSAHLENEVIQQFALISLKLLAKILATDHPAVFKPVLELTTNLVQSRDGPVLASAVLCLAELCGTMRTHAIHSLNTFIPAILLILKEKCQKSDCPEIVVLSVVSAVQKIVESHASFLSPHLDKLLFELVKLRSRYSDSDHIKIAQIVQRLKTTMLKLSTSVPLRILLPTVTKTYEKLIKQELYRCVDPLMNVLADSFSNAQSNDLNAAIHDLAGFFLNVLQFREDLISKNRLLDAPTLTDVALVEESASKALVTLVLKLSEASFRPLFYRLYDWAARNPNQKMRNITFYRLTANIAESLKSLFILFAGHFLKHAASLLASQNPCIAEDDGLRMPLEVNQVELVEVILLTLYRIFLYDPRNFVTEERFQTLAQPIIDQLENDIGGKDAYEKRAGDLIIPCIASFAGAIQDDSLHKQLVYQILLKTRHVKSYVRSSALNSIVEIARKLGDDFMPLLPETVPFLAELLEDEDEETEKLAQDAVRTLEEVLNEPLQKYF